jgi:hypothetical protein
VKIKNTVVNAEINPLVSIGMVHLEDVEMMAA